MVALAAEQLKSKDSSDLAAVMADIGVRARAAALPMGLASTEAKNAALLKAAAAIRREQGAILEANHRDVEAVKGKLSAAMIDRLALDPKRVESIAKGLEDVAGLADPVGTAAMGAAGREWVLGAASPAAVGRAYEQLIRGLQSGR